MSESIERRKAALADRYEIQKELGAGGRGMATEYDVQRTPRNGSNRDAGRSMISRLVLLGLVLAAPYHDLVAQSPETSVRPARVTGYLGAGNAYGGVGAAIETYFVPGRLSLFVAAGYFPSLSECSGHARPGLGVRAYGRAREASFYGELFLGVVRQVCIGGGEGVSDLDRDYGMGMSLGYRLWRNRHLVLHGSIGLGLGWRPDRTIARPLVAAGVGYRLP